MGLESSEGHFSFCNKADDVLLLVLYQPLTAIA